MYDGTCFHGSQIQGETPTVQLAINNTLNTLFRRPIPTVGASRTDEGVHALCNYFHFDLDEELRPELLYKCNAVLPQGIALKRICKATDPEFNARFEAIRRRYRYRIYTRKNPFLINKALFYPFPLDHEKLDHTAAIIKEYTQFESFSKRNAQSHTFNCTIHKSYWEHKDDELHYVVEGNRFLRGMVRGLVCTQLQVARGKIGLDDFRGIIEAQDCTKAFFNVSGHGLYLEEITYPEGTFEVLQTQ
jgi:tRNA pseudouridine38-40 synthase